MDNDSSRIHAPGYQLYQDSIFKIVCASLGRAIWLTDEGLEWLRRHLKPRGARHAKRILGKQPPVSQKQSLMRDGVTLTRYQTLQFSFWRSIEHNMVKSTAKWLEPPVMDLGCGDGVFAHNCLGRVDFGVDLDLSALSRVRQLKSDQHVALADASKGIPFPSNWFGSVFSNSVIEHVPALSELLDEVVRVLRPSGTFIFTVPGRPFLDYLTEFTGTRDAHKLNERMGHVNLYSGSEWCALLCQHGFRVDYVGYYLSQNAVRLWRVLLSRVFRFLEGHASDLLWSFLQNYLLLHVIRSLHLLEEGGGIIIVATRE